MKVSLIKRIELYAQKNPFWISGATYEKLAMEANFKASNCSRRLRELHTAGILERREVKGHVEYRFNFKEQMRRKEQMEEGEYWLKQIAPKKEQREEKQKVEAGVQKALV